MYKSKNLTPSATEKAEAPGMLHAARGRPSERVFEYLEAEFDRPELRHGSRLPTMRDIANRLGVSQPTVQGVFRKLAEEGRIITKVGNGSFLVQHRPGQAENLKIALSFPAPDAGQGDLWIYRIAGGIMNAVFRSPRRINVVSLPQDIAENARMKVLLGERSKVDALILSPVPEASRIRQIYEQAGKPVVELHPPTETATANFVAADYFGCSRTLARAWKQAGRKRVLFLRGSNEDVVSDNLRYAGLVNGFGASGGSGISIRVVEVASPTEAEVSRSLHAILANRDMQADAIYCMSDQMALEVVRVCQARGLRVPSDVSIVGGTGLDLMDSICPLLTRTRQPFEKLGEELISLACRRIEGDNISLPGQVLHTPFIGGGTTRKEENDLLGIARRPA